MNILHVINSLQCGGLEKVTIDLSMGLRERGHHVIVCCLEGLGDLYKDDLGGVEVISLNKKPGLDLRLPFRLAMRARRNKTDVIHTHNPGPLVYGTIAGKLAHVPAIINTRHGRAPKTYIGSLWAMNNAIAAISHDAKGELVKVNHIEPGKVRVVHNGIDLEGFDNSPNDHLNEKKKLGLDDTFVIGTVSRLAWEKDQASLIAAFEKVQALEPRVRLVFVGDGNLRHELEHQARRSGIEDKVIFLKFRDDVNSIIRSFDVFVLPSLMEGISISLLEAMASRLPVVVTDVGGNPEVVTDNETGILVPPKAPEKLQKAIVRLFNDKALARRLGEAGRKQVEEKFTIDNMVSEYEKVYEECVGAA